MKENKGEHNCPHCAKSGSADSDSDREEGLIAGRPLGLASACVFLVPLIGALVGIVIVNRLHLSELLGGAVGFLAGLALAMLFAGFFKRGKRQQ
jgi:hypothetical protein